MSKEKEWLDDPIQISGCITIVSQLVTDSYTARITNISIPGVLRVNLLEAKIITDGFNEWVTISTNDDIDTLKEMVFQGRIDDLVDTLQRLDEFLP